MNSITKANPKRSRAAGFSLIEVMVATAILMVVVLMVGSIFTQASSAWNSGYSHAEGGAALRGVAGAMNRDLQTAVDMRDFFPNENAPIKASARSLEFVSLKINDRQPGSGSSGGDASSPREYVLVEYSVGGDSVTRKETALVRSQSFDYFDRSSAWSKGSSTTSTLWKRGKTSSSSSPGEGSSADLSFSMEPIEIDSDDLDDRPYAASDSVAKDWRASGGSTVVGVKLRMSLNSSGSFSDLRVVSYGRDGLPNDESQTQDDIIAF